MIPKIIHQTWKNNDIPEHWKSSHEGYKKLEKYGWEVRLWTDADNRELIKTEFPWFLEQFDGYKHGIQRADAVRSFILYKFGGVYSDLDIEPKDNFAAFFDMYKNSELVLANKPQGYGFAGQNVTNCFMMSTPGCGFWPVVWKYLKDPFQKHWWKSTLSSSHHFNILFTTGPGTICDAVADYEEQGKEIVYIPAELVQPHSHNGEVPYETPQSVTRSLEGRSWQKDDSKFWRAIGGVGNNAVIVLASIAGLLLLVALYYIYKWKLCSSGKVVCNDGICLPRKNRTIKKSELYDMDEL